MKNILIIRTGALGDIIQTYPVIHYLHQKFPEAKIDWMVDPSTSALVKSHPYINQTLLVPTKAWKKQFFAKETWKTTWALWKNLRQTTYDVVFDLQGNLRSGLILSQVKSKNKVGFGLKSVPEWPNIFFTHKRYDPLAGKSSREDYLSLVSQFFGDIPPAVNDKITLKITSKQQTVLETLLKKITPSHFNIVVCPGSAWPNKQLKIETLIAFLRLIQQSIPSSRFLLVWGSENEKLMTEQIQRKLYDTSEIIDRVDLPILQHFIKNCNLVIAMDSMALHLAATTNAPSFSVFGASLAAKYKPLREEHQSFQGTCPYGYTFVKRCPILRTCPTGACIHDLTGELLFNQFQNDHHRSQLYKELPSIFE